MTVEVHCTYSLQGSCNLFFPFNVQEMETGVARCEPKDLKSFASFINFLKNTFYIIGTAHLDFMEARFSSHYFCLFISTGTFSLLWHFSFLMAWVLRNCENHCVNVFTTAQLQAINYLPWSSAVMFKHCKIYPSVFSPFYCTPFMFVFQSFARYNSHVHL